MTRALPKQYSCALCCLCFGFMVGGCGPVDVVQEETPVPKEDAVIDQAVKVLATASSSQPEDGLPVTAEIVDVIDGGRSGEWGVKVFFANGTGEGCSVDVVDRRRGDLLAHDDVNSSAEVSYEHTTRFRYRGSRASLRVQVTEKQSGTVLADFGS